MTIISYKLKQPLILGYIGAGIIIGPHTPPFNLISNTDVLNLFAEIGIILLLFTVGMEFPIQKLKSIGKRATIITVAEQAGTLIAGYFVGQALGFSLYDSLFLAVALSVSSTVIIMKILEELKVVREEASYLTMGILIIEDIVILSIFALLQKVSISGSISLTENRNTNRYYIGLYWRGFDNWLPNHTSIGGFRSKDQSERCFGCCCFGSRFWVCIYFQFIGYICCCWGIFCRSANCRVKNTFSHEYPDNPYQGYVCCIVFRIGWCIDGY